MNDLVELNRIRRNIALKKLKDLISDDQKVAFKNVKVFKNNKQITMNDIDFTKDCIFITDTDFLSIISYLGIQILNRVDLKDDTLTGSRSRIRTSYMVVTASDARMAMMSGELSEFDPEGWFIENYSRKDLILWQLPKLLGTGTDKDATSIVNSLTSLYEMRKFNRKLNWMFFVGTEDDFKNIFNTLRDIPVYVLKTSGLISSRKIKEEIF